MKLLDAPSQILNVINNKVRQPKYQVRQTKRQVRNFNQKSTPKKQMLIYAVLSRCNFCRKFTHFFGVPFTGLKIWWRTKNDKYEVCMTKGLLAYKYADDNDDIYGCTRMMIS